MFYYRRFHFPIFCVILLYAKCKLYFKTGAWMPDYDQATFFPRRFTSTAIMNEYIYVLSDISHSCSKYILKHFPLLRWWVSTMKPHSPWIIKDSFSNPNNLEKNYCGSYNGPAGAWFSFQCPYRHSQEFPLQRFQKSVIYGWSFL